MLVGRLLDVRAKPDGEPLSHGPLKTERFRRVKTGNPGDPGTEVNVPFASEKEGRLPSPEGGGRRETRMPDGNAPPVGVEGSTLTEACGDLPSREPDADDNPDGDASEALDVLEALEWVC